MDVYFFSFTVEYYIRVFFTAMMNIAVNNKKSGVDKDIRVIKLLMSTIKLITINDRKRIEIIALA